jgi:hypothetical protein
MRSALRYVVLGGFIAGTLDILYAFVFHGLRGVPPVSILQSIASGLLGPASYRGGAATAALGAALHFFIAIVAAAVFHAASLRWRWLTQHAIAAGIAFGLGMYAVMNYVVVPLSAFPHKAQFDPLVLAGGLLAHVFLVGVPISLCSRAAHRRA